MGSGSPGGGTRLRHRRHPDGTRAGTPWASRCTTDGTALRRRPDRGAGRLDHDGPGLGRDRGLWFADRAPAHTGLQPQDRTAHDNSQPTRPHRRRSRAAAMGTGGAPAHPPRSVVRVERSGSGLAVPPGRPRRRGRRQCQRRVTTFPPTPPPSLITTRRPTSPVDEHGEQRPCGLSDESHHRRHDRIPPRPQHRRRPRGLAMGENAYPPAAAQAKAIIHPANSRPSCNGSATVNLPTAECSPHSTPLVPRAGHRTGNTVRTDGDASSPLPVARDSDGWAGSVRCGRRPGRRLPRPRRRRTGQSRCPNRGA